MQQQQERHRRELEEFRLSGSRGYVGSPFGVSPHTERIETTETTEERLKRELEEEKRKSAGLEDQMRRESLGKETKKEEPIEETPSLPEIIAEESEEEESQVPAEPEPESEPVPTKRELEDTTQPDTTSDKKVMTVTPLKKRLYRPTKVCALMFTKRSY